MRTVSISTPEIELESFLKLSGVTSTGGQAKQLVQAGEVRVNGVREPRRGRKLHAGDVVAVGAVRLRVEVSGN